jgi:hypothetical protein
MANVTETLRAAAKAAPAPLERIKDAEAALIAEQEKLQTNLFELRQEAAKAALPAELGGDEGRYSRLLKEISSVEARIIKDQAAIHQTARMKGEARAARIAQQQADDVLKAQTFAKERQEICQDLAAHIAGAVDAWQRLHFKGQEIVAWRGELALAYGGLLLARTDVAELVRAEMARLSISDGLDAKASPRFPGTDWKETEGNPRKNTPLIEVARQSNDYLVERVRQRLA